MAEVFYGGQAVIEGVMIRSPRYVSVACRLPQADGEPGVDTPIDLHTEEIRSLLNRRPWLRRVPVLRGFLALFEMLGLGLRCLERSGNLQLPAAQALLVWPALALGSNGDSNGHEGAGALNGPLMWGTILLSFALGIALFVLLPNVVAHWLMRWWHLPEDGWVLSVIEGALRLAVFVGYVLAIGRMREIRRVFMYHGAEHKVVNAWEAGLEPDLEHAAGQSTIHPRCGTNFAFIVIVVSVVAFAFLPGGLNVLTRLGLRLACLPLIAGVSFELIRLVARVRVLRPCVAPGLWLQRLTTREPTPDMVEVALASFGAVRTAEETGELTRLVKSSVGAPA
jgi:uncharacterized protein YqhQ